VVAACCVFGRTESTSIEGATRLPDAHMIGGEVVEANTTRPVLGMLLVKDGKKTSGPVKLYSLKKHKLFTRSITF